MTVPVAKVCPNARASLEAARAAVRAADFERAAFELAQISDGQRTEPAVLQVEWLVQAANNNWAECLEIARALTYARPEKAACWIVLVKSLMRVGMAEEAEATLSRVERSFPGDSSVQALRQKMIQFLTMSQPQHKITRRGAGLRRSRR